MANEWWGYSRNVIEVIKATSEGGCGRKLGQAHQTWLSNHPLSPSAAFGK